ncbi:MAG TPA: choline ABC transporter permease subunit [Steroidobacteraceae bacterium]|nr:choline ABC transporter permease subunit [Steroidobacteraceae bacterium]
MGAPPAGAIDAAACRTVRFSDVGWTDITATTALAARLLEGLGYKPVTQILSIPVTYASMKSRQIDVYLGDWQPSMREDRKPYLADGSIEVVRANLEGAKYTLAVPSYVAAAGVRSFADLQRFADRFHRRIYGIEPGNNGNRIISAMIAQDRFELGGWTLVESSEQGMLSEVDRAIHRSEWIVFLGWSPHPMNLKYHLQYLAGGDDTFGANYGGATIYTDVRAGYLSECPNVAVLLKNLVFTPDIESRVMALILDGRLEGRAAATEFLSSHPQLLASWLAGVTAIDGQPGDRTVRRDLQASSLHKLKDWLDAANDWVTGHKIPLGRWLNDAVEYATDHAQGFFDAVSQALGGTITVLTAALMQIPALLLIAVVAAGAFLLQRSLSLALFIAASLLLIDNLGLWQATVQTLALVLFSTAVCMLIGVPIGIAAAHRPWLYRMLHPVLDLMQTIPTFVYLIPTLVLFGLGVVPGLISTVIFAIPAPIRLTHLGICSVPIQLREVGEAFGATRRQLLFKIELPHALPTIMAGITQAIMLSLSMVVIAALVGADGLGKPVVRALNSVNIAMGFESGLAIVILAIVLDRVFKRGRDSPRN